MSVVMSRKATVGIILVLLIVIGGIGGYYYYYLPSTRPLVPNAGTFVFQTFGEPDYMDPAVDYETAGGAIIENVYEGLVAYKGESMSEFEPGLATSWTVSPDGLVYTFKLRQNVKFHDGNVMTADDVKYSLDRAILINDPDGPAWILSQSIKGGPDYLSGDTWQVTDQAAVQAYLAAEGVKVVDAQTVQITLDHTYSPFVSTLAYTGPAAIVSKACVEANGGLVAGFHNEWMDQNAQCGTGPYKVVEWTANTRIVLERHEDYWAGKPAIQRVIIQNVEEVGTRELALFAGEADVISVGAANMFDIVDKDAWINQGQLVPLKKGIFVRSEPSVTISPVLQMNQLIKPFDNKNFRNGIRYAFDYDTFIETIYNGFAIRARSAIPKGFLGYDEQKVPLIPFDTAKAKEFFLAAKSEGAYTDGTVIAVFYNAGNEQRRRGLLLLKDTIDTLGVGFSLDVQALDWPTFLEEIRLQRLPVFFVGWAPDYADPDDFVIPFYDGRIGTYARRVGYSNDRVNELIDLAAREQDPAKRAAYYVEMQLAVHEDAVYLWTVQPSYTYVWRDWTKGFMHNAALASNSQGHVLFKLISKDERTDQVTIAIQNILPPVVLATILPVLTRPEGA
jgi:peptide/nickel transport system substrate-binding protein